MPPQKKETWFIASVCLVINYAEFLRRVSYLLDGNYSAYNLHIGWCMIDFAGRIKESRSFYPWVPICQINQRKVNTNDTNRDTCTSFSVLQPETNSLQANSSFRLIDFSASLSNEIKNLILPKHHKFCLVSEQMCACCLVNKDVTPNCFNAKARWNEHKVVWAIKISIIIYIYQFDVKPIWSKLYNNIP